MNHQEILQNIVEVTKGIVLILVKSCTMVLEGFSSFDYLNQRCRIALERSRHTSSGATGAEVISPEEKRRDQFSLMNSQSVLLHNFIKLENMARRLWWAGYGLNCQANERMSVDESPGV